MENSSSQPDREVMDMNYRGQIPFNILVGNFRRKMILETLADNTRNQEDKDKILAPYEDFLKSQTKKIKQ